MIRTDLSVLLAPHQGEPQWPLPSVSSSVRRYDGRVQGDQARRVRVVGEGGEGGRADAFGR